MLWDTSLKANLSHTKYSYAYDFEDNEFFVAKSIGIAQSIPAVSWALQCNWVFLNPTIMQYSVYQ